MSFDLGLHDKAFPGPAGFAAFALVKFGGYVLAGLFLRKLYPSIVAGAAKIAAVRTVLGILIGPVFVISAAVLADHLKLSSDSFITPYSLLLCMRILIWAFVIWLFIRRTSEPRGYLWAHAAGGALWSCVLDLPAFFLLAIAPGKIPIC